MVNNYLALFKKKFVGCFIVTALTFKINLGDYKNYNFYN